MSLSQQSQDEEVVATPFVDLDTSAEIEDLGSNSPVSIDIDEDVEDWEVASVPSAAGENSSMSNSPDKPILIEPYTGSSSTKQDVEISDASSKERANESARSELGGVEHKRMIDAEVSKPSRRPAIPAVTEVDDVEESPPTSRDIQPAEKQPPAPHRFVPLATSTAPSALSKKIGIAAVGIQSSVSSSENGTRADSPAAETSRGKSPLGHAMSLVQQVFQAQTSDTPHRAIHEETAASVPAASDAQTATISKSSAPQAAAVGSADSGLAPKSTTTTAPTPFTTSSPAPTLPSTTSAAGVSRIPMTKKQLRLFATERERLLRTVRRDLGMDEAVFADFVRSSPASQRPSELVRNLSPTLEVNDELFYNWFADLRSKSSVKKSASERKRGRSTGGSSSASSSSSVSGSVSGSHKNESAAAAATKKKRRGRPPKDASQTVPLPVLSTSQKEALLSALLSVDGVNRAIDLLGLKDHRSLSPSLTTGSTSSTAGSPQQQQTRVDETVAAIGSLKKRLTGSTTTQVLLDAEVQQLREENERLRKDKTRLLRVLQINQRFVDRVGEVVRVVNSMVESGDD